MGMTIEGEGQNELPFEDCDEPVYYINASNEEQKVGIPLTSVEPLVAEGKALPMPVGPFPRSYYLIGKDLQFNVVRFVLDHFVIGEAKLTTANPRPKLTESQCRAYHELSEEGYRILIV